MKKRVGGRIYDVVLGSPMLPGHPEFDTTIPLWADPADIAAWERALKVWYLEPKGSKQTNCVHKSSKRAVKGGLVN